MDFVSHGLWGGVAFGRNNKKSFWLAFLFGMAPDVLAFGPFFIQRIIGGDAIFRGGPPAPAAIPAYIHSVYNITHSLVIFAIAFGIAWLIFKRPIWEMSAWGLHVAMDIFTHTLQFFPTPFLWPLSNFKVNGISWGTPTIFFPNLASLAILYIWFFGKKIISGRSRNRQHDI